MKKMLLTAAIAALGVFGANAQEIEFGAKAGLNFANVGGDVENSDMLTSFHAGVVGELMISDDFAVQAELLYSMQGASNEYTETVEMFGVTAQSSVEQELKLGYLNLPILAKYYFTDGLSVHAGPQVGYLLSAEREDKETVTAGGESASETRTVDLKDAEIMSNIDFSLAAGLEYQLEMGVFFQARYTLGLSNIYDYEDDNNDSSVQNNVIQLSVGYKF